MNKKWAVWPNAAVLGLCAGLVLLPAISGFCQQTPSSAPKPPAALAAPATADTDQDQPIPGDWGPELLYGILSSPNDEAEFGLLRAAFAAGPAIIPQLTEALKDDRTAEFAAQSLAYIGSNEALPALEKLLSDPRDLNLRRFSFGALGEFDSSQATNILFDVINKSDNEPDRTVTEAAIIALTVRTDTAVLTRITDSEKKLQDPVIRDDLDNAHAVIAERAKYLATPEGKKSGGSIESAVRTYFIPALEPPPAESPAASSPPKPAPRAAGKVIGKAPVTHAPAPAHSQVTVEVSSVTFSPDKNRVLARVLFEDPTALAYYDFVLQKRFGEWTIASVWLGPEMEKPDVRIGHTGAGAAGSETQAPK